MSFWPVLIQKDRQPFKPVYLGFMASFGERKLWDLGLTSGKSEEGKGQRPPL
jgi:hypothetical protein